MTAATDMADIFLETMGTARAVRHFKPDPIPRELIERLIWAATRAPSPENTQQWAFVCVDDRAILQRIQSATEAMAPMLDQKERPDRSADRILNGAAHLARTLGEVPLLVFVCGPLGYPPEFPSEYMAWSALFPATQNLILAAHALGLGTALTLFHLAAEKLVREELAIPDDWVIAAAIPVGYPAVPTGPVKRRPVEEVLFMNHFENRA